MLILNNIRKSFNKNTENQIDIFKGLDLTFEEARCTAIIGANGCGKSTLMNLISGSLDLDGGTIVLKNRDISSLREESRSKYIGRVFQDPSLGVSPSLSILENMSLADKKGESFCLKRLVKRDRIDYYKSLLSSLDLGLENKLDTKVKFLSGGQRQSLSLIMATMKKPDLLLLDEHTAALDPKTSRVIMDKTKELIEKSKITTIMISHNMRDAIDYSDRLIMLDRGRLVLDVNSRDVSEDDLLDIYRKGLLS